MIHRGLEASRELAEGIVNTAAGLVGTAAILGLAIAMTAQGWRRFALFG